MTQGRNTFEQILADPDSLAPLPVVVAAAANSEDLSAEDMLSVAWQAYRSAAGDDLPPNSFTIRYPDLDPDWAFDFDDEAEMRRRLPRLTNLYYGPAD
jgi:hypothetical protein